LLQIKIIFQSVRIFFPKADQILHSVVNGLPPLQHLRR